jgi:hypothetical protein
LDYLEGKVATIGSHQLRLEAAQVALEGAKAQSAKAQAQVLIDQATYERAVSGGLPMPTQEQAMKDWQQAKIAVTQASLAVTRAQQALTSVP